MCTDARLVFCRPRGRKKSPILAGLTPCAQCNGRGIIRRHTPNFARLGKLEVPLIMRVGLLLAIRTASVPIATLCAKRSFVFLIYVCICIMNLLCQAFGSAKVMSLCCAHRL